MRGRRLESPLDVMARIPRMLRCIGLNLHVAQGPAAARRLDGFVPQGLARDNIKHSSFVLAVGDQSLS